MSEKKLHIVSLDNPFPPNYGGIIDIFYQVKALHKIGFTIYLHCFTREIPEKYDELKAISSAVYFYPIKEKPFYFFSKLPFSVISRNDKSLAENLAAIEAPIIFQSLKTTCLIQDVRLAKQKKILRLQNIEEDYFEGLFKSEKSLLKKLLYWMESRKYRNYKEVFSFVDEVVTLSKFENEVAENSGVKASYVPVFHGNEAVVSLEGFGEYVIYHGDLNTADNRKALEFLVDVFKKLPDKKLVVASGSNQEFVENMIANAKNIQFVKLLHFEHLKELLQQSHISISWSFQKSGTKLKSINSLFNTRFCIINENIIDDDIVSDLCVLVKTEEELIRQIEYLSQQPFLDYAKRKDVLEGYMSDVNNARKIEALINGTA